MSEVELQVMNMPDAAVVRLQDGRVGYKGKGIVKRTVLIVFPDGSGQRIPQEERVVMLKSPFALAFDYLNQEREG